ncbi:MAG TPA: hypothetical protein VHW23_24825 [Kofleriaceae bacterium]|jgi:hypothetical protein|nr:hypothetical protein [Kofleriaceae bacterium]
MRLTTFTLAALSSLAAACLGTTGDSRKPSTGSGSDTSDGRPCSQVEMDVTIRSTADMAMLPRTGCYDLYGKLTVQGQAITSLAGLNELNSVNELDLDHTAVTTIDTRRPIGIYGKLTLTGNTKLTNLQPLSFETASTGILIDGNTALTSLDPLGLDDPMLDEVDGDIAITGNPALTTIPLGNLTKLTGALTVSGNSALTSLALGQLAGAGHIEVSDNAKLASLGAMSALYRVTGSVTIDGNAALTDLAAFTTSLKFIDQTLTISNNPALTDLGALKHVSLIGAISITGNPSLVSCRATEVDKCTQHPVTSVISSNKTTSCTTSCN